MMSAETRSYKQRFNKALEPVKVMLVNRRSAWSDVEWLHFVETTKESVLSNPEQYLNGSLPEKQIVYDVVEMIFADFLKTEGTRLRA